MKLFFQIDLIAMTSTSRTWTIVALVRRLRSVSKTQIVAAVLVGFLFSALVGYSGAFFFLLLLSLPIVAFCAHILRVQAHYEITDREVAQLLITFGGGMFPGAIVAVTFELVLAPLLAIMCFYDQRESLLDQLNEFLESSPTGTPAPPHAGRLANVIQTLRIERTFGFYIFMFLSAFVVAGLVEETTKLWVVQGKCLCNCTSRPRGWLCDPRRLILKRVDNRSHHVVIALAVTAAALGFASLENAAFTFATPTFSDRLQTAVLRSVLSLPLHGICGAITGIRLARALLFTTPETTLSPWRQHCWILYPSVMLHGAFDLQVFLVSSFISSETAEARPFLYEIFLPSMLAFGMLLGAFKVGHQQWRQLDAVASGHGKYSHLSGERDLNDDSDEDNGDDDINSHKRSVELVV